MAKVHAHKQRSQPITAAFESDCESPWPCEFYSENWLDYCRQLIARHNAKARWSEWFLQTLEGGRVRVMCQPLYARYKIIKRESGVIACGVK